MMMIQHPLKEFYNETFVMAQRQLDEVAKTMNLDAGVHERLRWPRKSLMVSVPIKLDNGVVKVFTGYRVQHDQTLGPPRGAFAFITMCSWGK